ncbi:MAG: hypothetical protein R2873_29145 [Caldilineaceae bacterium]
MARAFITVIWASGLADLSGVDEPPRTPVVAHQPVYGVKVAGFGQFALRPQQGGARSTVARRCPWAHGGFHPIPLRVRR